LGNTVAFTEKALGQIAELIEEKSIKEITFILSEDNNILQDALNSQSFVGTRGLYKPYSDFLEYKKQITEIWQTNHQKDLIISYHLHQKIKALKKGLSDFLLNIPDTNGQVYSKTNNTFRLIHSHMVFLNSCQIN